LDTAENTSNTITIGLVEPFPEKPCTLVLGIHAGASYINALDTGVNGHIINEVRTSFSMLNDYLCAVYFETGTKGYEQGGCRYIDCR
jgi:hypothetical protein